ncbi:MAG: hypothetical protein Q4D20_04470 [Clostridia bacterium]|nr:hypothetical protein [Clostridia bacterium]
MKKAKKIFALILVASIICSFAFVFSLSGFPAHDTHLCRESGCFICALVNFAQTLFKTFGLTAVFSVLVAIFCARRFVPIDRNLPVKTQYETPVTLKTKILG